MDIAEEKNKIELANVNIDSDLELILAWRSNPEVYKWFYQQRGPLVWEDHIKFWSSDKKRKDWIILYNGRKVGSVFVSFLDLDNVPDVGIYVGETTLWGKGVGTAALELVKDWLRQNNFKEAQARIHKKNTMSKLLFEKVGFICQEGWIINDQWHLYKIIL